MQIIQEIRKGRQGGRAFILYTSLHLWQQPRLRHWLSFMNVTENNATTSIIKLFKRIKKGELPTRNLPPLLLSKKVLWGHAFGCDEYNSNFNAGFDLIRHLLTGYVKSPGNLLIWQHYVLHLQKRLFHNSDLNFVTKRQVKHYVQIVFRLPCLLISKQTNN